MICTLGADSAYSIPSRFSTHAILRYSCARTHTAERTMGDQYSEPPCMACVYISRDGRLNPTGLGLRGLLRAQLIKLYYYTVRGILLRTLRKLILSMNKSVRDADITWPAVFVTIGEGMIFYVHRSLPRWGYIAGFVGVR